MHEDHGLRHPKPQDDGIAAMRDWEVCGFGSRDDLDAWFAGYRRDLYAAGFNIAVYKVSPDLVRYGGHQLVFERGDLLPFDHLPLIRNGLIHN